MADIAAMWSLPQLEQEGSWYKRFISNPQTKKTIIAIAVGAVGGFLFWYFSEGRTMGEISIKLIAKSMLIGGFFGFFVTNSPCARGRC